MLPHITVEQYAAQQRIVVRNAQAAYHRWLQANPGASSEQAKAAAVQITQAYRRVAERNANTFYQSQREWAGVEGDYALEAIGEYSPDNLSNWLDGMFDDGFVDGGIRDWMDVAVEQAGRRQMRRNAERDPAGVRWARMPIGETCAWCLMLASRGAVYLSEESAGSGGHFHAQCDCQIVAVFPG